MFLLKIRIDCELEACSKEANFLSKITEYHIVGATMLDLFFTTMMLFDSNFAPNSNFSSNILTQKGNRNSSTNDTNTATTSNDTTTTATSSDRAYSRSSLFEFKPRRNYRTPGGSRGCPDKVTTAIALLVPQDHIPLTISSHPTFWWYLSEKISLPILFTLLEPGHKPIYSKEFKANSSGFMALTLPETAPPLEIGKEYRWSVSIICNPQKPSQNIYTEAWIERVDATQVKVEEQTELSCHLAYAQLGLWYDALSCNLGFKQASFKKEVNQDILFLLEEVDLDLILDSQDLSLINSLETN